MEARGDLEEGELEEPNKEPGLEQEEQEMGLTDRSFAYILACIPLHDYESQKELDRGRLTLNSYVYALVFESDEDTAEWHSFEYARDCQRFNEMTWRFDEKWRDLYNNRQHCTDLIVGIQILWDNREERPTYMGPCINLLHTVPYRF